MEIKNTKDYPKNVPLMILVYGMGGVGKTTFASTFPNALLMDFENGAKYFGQRGIEIDVLQRTGWFESKEYESLKKAVEKYDTLVIDPIGEAMQKIINSPSISGAKYRQGGSGDLTMAGWGKVKENMRNFIKWLRDTGKHVVIIAHVDEQMDGETMVKRPLIATKLSDELITMVDIVAYMSSVKAVDKETGESEVKRVLVIDPTDETKISKDRTGKLGKYVKPEYSAIAKSLNFESNNNKKDDKNTEDKPQAL